MNKSIKRVRVLREMPFAKVGEEFEPNGLLVTIGKIYTWSKFTCSANALVDGGWIEWVEEEKSLEDKFMDVELPKDGEMCGNCFGPKATKILFQIATDHFKEKFNEAIKEYDSTCGNENRDSQRKVIRKVVFGNDT